MKAFLKRWVVMFGWSTLVLGCIMTFTLGNPPAALGAGALLSLMWLGPAFVLTGLYELAVRSK